jgi:hypothetical protein
MHNTLPLVLNSVDDPSLSYTTSGYRVAGGGGEWRMVRPPQAAEFNVGGRKIFFLVKYVNCALKILNR